MKAKLALSQTQSLLFTQDLRQAIFLLSLNSLKLDELVDAEQLSNPALQIENDEPVSWVGSFEGKSQYDIALEECASPWDFRQSLMEQTRYFNAMERSIAKNLIYNLDDDGLLTDVSGVFSFIIEELGVFPEWIELVRKRLMDLDPLGCGAIDVNEVLSHQLNRIFINRPQGIFDLLEKLREDKTTIHSHSALTNALRGVDLNRLKALSPRPASHLNGPDGSEERIYADVVVTEDASGFSVALIREPSRRIQWSHLNVGKSAQTKFLKDGVRQAQNLYKALLYREQSLLKVTKAIVFQQSQWFFKAGELSPLILADVAQATGLHESTISRLTSANSLLCSRGVYGLKYFFSGEFINADNGNSHSTTSIKIKIEKLVQNENKGNPLSDQDMATLLLKEGITISRRTIAKYRQQKNILPAQKRRLPIF